MRSLIIGLLLLVGTAAYGDPSVNNSAAVNDQSNYGTANGITQQQNYQINQNNNAKQTFGGGVSCATPSLNFGVIGGDGYKGIATASVNIPLGDGDCKEAREQQIALMRQDLHARGVEQSKKDILFEVRMARECSELSRTITFRKDTDIYKECSKYLAHSTLVGR